MTLVFCCRGNVYKFAFCGDRSREFIHKGDILTIMKNMPSLDFKKIKEYADIFNVWDEIKNIKDRS